MMNLFQTFYFLYACFHPSIEPCISFEQISAIYQHYIKKNFKIEKWKTSETGVQIFENGVLYYIYPAKSYK